MRNINTKNTSRAPMRNESYKRFSIYKKQEKRSWLDFLFDWIVKGIIMALMISINFVLFASSANYSLFAEGLYVIPNIVIPMVIIFTISIGAMFFISFSRILENILVSVVIGCVSYATINQFMTISPDSFLYSMFYGLSPEFAMHFINNSDILTAVVFSIITFFFLTAVSNRIVFFASIFLMVVLALVIADEYINQRHKQEFVTLYEKENIKAKVRGNKFIYIMLPNAASYRYISDMEDDKIASDDVRRTKEHMLGFFAKNNFTLYDNAYVGDEDYLMNIVSQFNILSNKKVEDSVLDNVLIDSYLKFKNHNEKSVYLEDNKLFNKFKNAKYRINVYQSHGIELCKSNNEIIADKCVEKQNHPFNFEGMDISEIKKTSLLLLQWINSTTLFKDLSVWYEFINTFTDASKVALLGIPYNNLHVINSIKTLDIMFNDVLSEDANTTYFALLDIPSEMYVYDEFCNIKTSDKWLSKDNLPWVKIPNLVERRKAYLQQTDCLYSKLNEFMEKLKAYDIDGNTVVVIQGISGIDNKKGSQDFIETFNSKKSVIMAIREPRKNGFQVDYEVCPVSGVLIKYLYGKNICRPLEDLNISKQSKSDLYKSIISGNKHITKYDVAKAKYTFSEWYKIWEKNSSSNNKGVQIIRDMLTFENPILSKAVPKPVDKKPVQEKPQEKQPKQIVEAPKKIEPKMFIEVINNNTKVVEKTVVEKPVVEKSVDDVSSAVNTPVLEKTNKTSEIEEDFFDEANANMQDEEKLKDEKKEQEPVVDENEELVIDLNELLATPIN